jgi:ferredoxin
MCINCGACVIVCRVEAIFNKADLPEWGSETPGRHRHTRHGIGRAGVCLFPEQVAAGRLRMDAKDERTRAVGGRWNTADVHKHTSPQRRGRDGGKGGSR